MRANPRCPEESRVEREVRFGRLYAAHGRQILAYAVRRAVDPDAAADAVAETFLVAWRRLDAVPAGDEARLWLYGVARRVLSNQHRGERRRQRLAEQLAGELFSALATPPAPECDAAAIREALSRLEPDDREILRLAAWEGLSSRETATVLGITQIAARSRLHRARKRLRALLDDDAAANQVELMNARAAL